MNKIDDKGFELWKQKTNNHNREDCEAAFVGVFDDPKDFAADYVDGWDITPEWILDAIDYKKVADMLFMSGYFLVKDEEEGTLYIFKDF